MKKSKLKIVLATIISMILVMLITSVAFSNKIYSASGAIELERLIKDKKYYYISFAHLINYDNVYCIQKGQSFPHQLKPMVLKYRLWLEGSTGYAQLHKYKGPDEHHFEYDYQETDNSGFVNLMAAIICESDMGLGYGSNAGVYTNSQKALYYYWNQFLSKTGLDAYMKGSGSNASIASDGNINNIIEKYKEYASQKSYEANIYYFVSASGNLQRLILVQRLGEEEKSIDIPVKKEWNDGNNKYNTRSDITVELLANGNSTGNTLTLNQSNNWEGKFTDLNPNDDNGKAIKYTIKEIGVSGYTSSISGSMNDGFTITNTLLTEVKVVKQWEDKDDLDEYRPDSLKVTLYSNGLSTGKTVTLDESNDWTATFEKLNKYDKNGKEINYTVQEETIAKYEKPEYSKAEDSKDGHITWTITNKHTPKYDGYIEISGKVWIDMPDGKGNDIDGNYVDPNTDKDSKDILKEGVTVRLKYIDTNGKHQLFNPNLPNAYETKTNSYGEYTIRVNYDNSQNVYKLYEDVATVNKKLETAYVEFEYDGMQYTTVASAATGANTSKATENEASRNKFDSNHSTVTVGTSHPDSWTDKTITAVTNKVTSYEGKDESKEVVVKYCNGNGTYICTNPEGAWKDILPGTNDLACNSGEGHELRKYGITVQKIPNINLGLFEREQPDVAIFSDISKVEVEMNKQRYTYIYGVRGNKLEAEGGIQTKFQNKGTYTYRRPVNPADIAYIKEEANKNAMEVYVTYQISVANLSNTLTVVVDSIANDYDSNYIINSDIIYGTMNETTGEIIGTPLRAEQISKPENKGGYNEIILSGLGIEVNGLAESKNKIYIRYQIDQTKLPELFNDNTPPLNNATEILSYSIKYGTNTLYAEQRTNLKEKEQGREERKSYAGYDFDSHPGNANIKLMTGKDGVQRLYSTDVNGEIIETDMVEDDTDIAPAFALCKDAEPKVLSGTVWEDTDKDNGSGPENFRLGDGKKSASENVVANAKVELYKVNDDGTTTLANLYKIDKETGEISSKPAVAYSNNEGGYYSFGSKDEGYSVVTDRYLIKFTYGEGISKEDGTTTSSTIKDVDISGRDYKSTIISPETELYNLFKETSNSEEWHLNISKGYSIAVDEIQKRVEMEDLQYSNYDNAIAMTAYSKPFKMQVEFNPSQNKQSSVLEDGKTIKGGNEILNNELNVFDFGIIEMAREDIYAQKTVDYLKITLANGQVLIEGDPTEQNLNYVKAIGYKQKINSGKEARDALEKRMLIEIDSELIQGAQLEVRYAINVVNNSEKDYDYYVSDQIKTEYYYFGTNDVDKSPIITSSVNYLVDYVDSDFVYTWENADNWSEVTDSELDIEGKELVNQETIKVLNSGKYTAYATTIFSELKPGEPSTTEHATARKLLTSKDENVYENHVEILKIDAKTARTMSGKDDNGTPIIKQYKPGNYVPSASSRYIDDNVNSNMAGRHEQDDDIAKIIITPPTGVTSETITYIMAAVVELMIVLTGIIYIKKKRLIK